MNNRECFYIIKRYQEILKLKYTPKLESETRLEQTFEKIKLLGKLKNKK